MAPPRLALVFLVALAGCGAAPRWHAGVLPEDPDDPPRAGRPAEEVEVYFKPALGVFDETRAERRFMCGSTTLLRTAFLLEDAPPPAPDRGWEVLGLVTTEEFPRDEEASELKGDEVTNVFGIGRSVHDTYEVRLDPAFREAALERLRWWAARVGADAVVDVYATGEVEHHMWHGTVISFDLQSPHSPIYSGVRLLDLRLRDVRLHGTAVRYER
ncbi:MAG: YbjQ family protein [Planctomycetes bacterium]|nr:YbjQ family protein [Planctomycetota bacterium]